VSIRLEKKFYLPGLSKKAFLDSDLLENHIPNKGWFLKAFIIKHVLKINNSKATLSQSPSILFIF
jgi:hypothetical protein